MTAMLVLALGIGGAFAMWRLSAAGAQRAHELVVIVTLAMLAATVDIVVPIPDLELTTTVVACVALVLGVRAGTLTAIVAVLLSGAVAGLGPWVPWQIVAFAMVAAGAAGIGRVVTPARLITTHRPLLVATIAILVAAYDALTTVTTTTLVTNLPLTEAGRVLLVGLPFTLLHVVGSALVTWFAAPVLVPGLQRVRRRLDVQVDERPIDVA